ncbi:MULTISPECIES: aldo/keto reductase [unclassified Haloferax]|uniref:aldo/keto reductase n=1 Tax=unclassified Haloferax TaxID=2625095 RepID=UPI000E2560A1|nr:MULTISPECIES: aldo/keto reductase [unclassified Haloferax]RDZ32147.1 2,5-diketo-D-gluconic acid reductase [Haloferax sp. Atlit-24N]RDZ35742.1 2,5-diketo-D-gluconic acid reductase [Haloferax sp. Atlit-47N]RLM33287.1 aldo/keto reductase [Haloferax sp. Atlit-109R]RLM40676.1 aldo/keto reductase [Haloferax sp. Atlit-105R]
MKTVELNNGVEMPILGFGTYQIEDLDECERSVSEALDTGYRLIDTAASYENEEAVGRAIEKSDVPRDEVFVTSKLWVQDTGYEATLDAFERSLDRLGLDYLDLFLIHQPYGDVHCSWQAMEDLYEDGKIRAIGVSNFHPDRVMDLMVHNDVVPAVNQIETHPFYQRIEDAAFLEEQDIQHESWGPFAEGQNDIFEHDVLTTIGDRHGKSAAQVVLRWLIQREIVAIPKSVHADRIAENFDVFDFELTTEEMETISELDEGESQFFDHRDPEMVKWLGEAERDT